MKNTTPVRWNNCLVQDNFLFPRMKTAHETTIPSSVKRCYETGRIEAFKHNWQEGMPNKPHIYWDSDVAKVIEGMAFDLVLNPDSEREKQMEEIISLIVSSQLEDGYLNSYFAHIAPDERWKIIHDNHELYCAGHLIEAAVAHFQATGRRNFLDAMCRYADYISTVFGREEGKLRAYPGHQELELALCKLAQATGKEKYWQLAAYFVDERGTEPNYFREVEGMRPEGKGYHSKPFSVDYAQAHKPVREQSEAVGHAVRAGYLYSGMADVARKYNDTALLAACEKLFDDIVEKKMYITGSIGSELVGESFDKPYALPNATAYAETCAAISLAMFADRMLNITGDMKYADVVEKAIYNGILSGISLSGDRYFYKNMLEINPRTTYETQRRLWFNTSCCPTNFCRFLPQLGSYLWSESEEGVRLNIPAQSTFSSNGIRISVKGNYPYDGKIVITFESAGEFTFACRIPGWCRSCQVKLNGSVERINGNAPEWHRAWQEGDCIELELDMPIELVYSSTDVIEDIGKAAICRGPLVYAVEVCDVSEELWRYVIDRASLRLTPDNGLPEGTLGISGRALREKKRGDSLYTTEAPEYEEVTFTAVPYSLWQNRGPSTMQVWMRY